MSVQAIEKEYQAASDRPEAASEPAALDPGHIMQTATAFWASKVLLTEIIDQNKPKTFVAAAMLSPV